MTKLSPKFCYQIRAGTDPEKACWFGILLSQVMIHIDEMENGVELMRVISKSFPEIEVLQE